MMVAEAQNFPPELVAKLRAARLQGSIVMDNNTAVLGALE